MMKNRLLSAVLLVASFTTFAQVGVGIGTNTPEGVLDVVSSTSGVIFPRVANIDKVSMPVNGMVVYDVSEKCLRGYQDGSWTSCGLTGVTVTDTTTEIVDVTSDTGRIWMDRNLGASQVALSATDSLSFGDLYQWGRRKDGHESRVSDTISTLSSSTIPVHGDFIVADNPGIWSSLINDNLWQGATGVNNPCPTNYRIPTKAEWDSEIALFSGTGDLNSAYSSSLVLPAAGLRIAYIGVVDSVNTQGNYWSSTVNNSEAFYAVTNTQTLTEDFFRAYGMSVRCIKDAIDTTTEIVEVTSSTTNRIWMDRNLGASKVATSFNDVASYGDIYQWGRRKDGHESRVSDSITNVSSTNVPGHGDFILNINPNINWTSSPDNDSLWQGVNGVNNPCPTNFRIPTHMEWLAEVPTSLTDGSASAFTDSGLFLTVTGTRQPANNNFHGIGFEGHYWTSTIGSNPDTAIYLITTATSTKYKQIVRSYGMSVRCIKEE
jgi:uncharacterized protein (TIGR02145 family)